MGLYETYEFPPMYTSPELDAATKTPVEQARKNDVILGLFFVRHRPRGRVSGEGFTFISIVSDLQHILAQATAYMKGMEAASADHADVGRAPRGVRCGFSAPFFSDGGRFHC
jgi:hypothetical protein